MVLAIFAISTLGAQGMPQMNPEDMAKRQADAIKEKVKLTEDQYKKVFEINLKSSQEMIKQMGQNRDMSAMMKMNAQRDSLIKLVLTPDQVKLYDEYLKERRNMRGQGPGGPR